MRLSKLYIEDFNQFQQFELDLTYPESSDRAGEALDKICFIGPNGVGKSQLLRWIRDHLNTNKLLSAQIIYLPAEVEKNNLLNLGTVPQTNLNDALKLFDDFPRYHEVSNVKVKEFWQLLIYHIKKRENDYRAYELKEENQEKTVKELRQTFNQANPEILKSLSEVWNWILEKAGLYFDYEAAKNPIQLTDNLEAYIKLKSSGKQIPYTALSTGIRNFIFRIGHIYALFFNQDIKESYLLIDEPENSLFPDFLYDLVGIYQKITKNTQIIMATHNPIIAAQFEPEERFILEFDEQFTVKARRGITAVGDDPNDILVKDFGIRSLLGKEGLKKWERFIELKILMQQSENGKEKMEMMKEFMSIGNEYNFPVQ